MEKGVLEATLDSFGVDRFCGVEVDPIDLYESEDNDMVVNPGLLPEAAQATSDGTHDNLLTCGSITDVCQSGCSTLGTEGQGPEVTRREW